MLTVQYGYVTYHVVSMASQNSINSLFRTSVQEIRSAHKI